MPWPAVEEEPQRSAGGPQRMPVEHVRIDLRGEVGRRAAMLLLIQPPERAGVGDSVEAEVVGEFGLRRGRSRRIEERLPVLDEVELEPGVADLLEDVGGGPERGERVVGRGDHLDRLGRVERHYDRVREAGEGCRNPVAKGFGIAAPADQEPLPEPLRPLRVIGTPEDRHHAAVVRIVERGQIPVAPAGTAAATDPLRVLLRGCEVGERQPVDLGKHQSVGGIGARLWPARFHRRAARPAE